MIVKPKKNLMLSFTCKEAQCMVSLSPHQKNEASRDGLIIHLSHHNMFLTLPYYDFKKYFREVKEI